MLTSCPGRRARRGVSLVELLATMAIGGVVLALITAIALRGHRFFGGMADVLAVSRQLHESAAILPIDLRAISSGAGDIRVGEARDTSIETRANIGSAVVCDTAGGRLILAPVVAAGAFASFVSPPQVNDTAWLLTSRDSSETWRPHQVLEVGSAPPGACSARGPTLAATELAATRITVLLDSLTELGQVLAVPLRVTRPLRYSLYRSSDAGWYLGQREWNPTTQRFNTIQPVSGPFSSPSAGGLRFQYFDSLGVEVEAASPSPRSIALLRIALRAETERVVRVAGLSVGANGRRSDSLVVNVLIRNRR